MIIDSSPVSATINTWYDIQIEWGSDNTHIATLYDDSGTSLGSVSGTDSTYTDGGIGYRVGFGGHGYFDHYRMVE